MPKTKPTKTESLRIELQDTERKYLERVADSVAFRNYMKPITDLATDNTIFYVVLLPILTLISGWIGLKWIQQTDLYNDAKEMFDDWNLQYQAARKLALFQPSQRWFSQGFPAFLPQWAIFSNRGPEKPLTG